MYDVYSTIEMKNIYHTLYAGQSAMLLGYLEGFWAAPTEWPTTTTTAMPCDTIGAQSCAVTPITFSSPLRPPDHSGHHRHPGHL